MNPRTNPKHEPKLEFRNKTMNRSMNPSMNQPVNPSVNPSVNPPVNHQAESLDLWEQHLDDSLLTPPTDFTARVMSSISSSSRLVQAHTHTQLHTQSPLVPLAALQRLRAMPRLRHALQWLALTLAAGLGGALGAAQLVGFMFGVWAAVAAG
jgi:hypothetical protein